MSAWAKPGAKVVCINANFYCGPSPLVKGAVYVIARVATHNGSAHGEYKNAHTVINLRGLDNPYAPASKAFALGRFRPLITKTQEEDVALFRPLLTDFPVKEPV